MRVLTLLIVCCAFLTALLLPLLFDRKLTAHAVDDAPANGTIPQDAIIVPSGFTVTQIISGLSPIAPSGLEYYQSLEDIEVGRGTYGDYLYFIDNEVIYRVGLQSGVAETFAAVPAAAVMRFGFADELFVGTDDITGTVFKVDPTGTMSKFAEVGSATEGMAFTGTDLFFSEWRPAQIQRIDASGQTTPFVPSGQVGRETNGIEFCASGFPLYVIAQNGTIFSVTADGTASALAGIDTSPQIAFGETVACGNSLTAFGPYLYVAEQDGQPAGRILRVSFSGTVEEFASGFEGFSRRGVTGLKFSSDGRTLYVTDDVGRAIYAIRSTVEPQHVFLPLVTR